MKPFVNINELLDVRKQLSLYNKYYGTIEAWRLQCLINNEKNIKDKKG